MKGEKGVQRPVVRTIEDLLSSKRLGDFVHSGWSTTRKEAGVIGVWAHWEPPIRGINYMP